MFQLALVVIEHWEFVFFIPKKINIAYFSNNKRCY